MSIDLKKEARINQLVLEYLSFRDYKASHNAFEKELRHRIPHQLMQDTGSKAQQRQTLETQFVSAFREGDQQMFFALWDDNFPETQRTGDMSLQRLEFLVNVYFAVYPLLNVSKSKLMVFVTRL
eukprot:jgi/Hompol1/3301/HPOL_003193-RA